MPLGSQATADTLGLKKQIKATTDSIEANRIKEQNAYLFTKGMTEEAASKSPAGKEETAARAESERLYKKRLAQEAALNKSRRGSK